MLIMATDYRANKDNILMWIIYYSIHLRIEGHLTFKIYLTIKGHLNSQ
jgi:hypothetical protein